MNGGHGANAPLPTVRTARNDGEPVIYARFADTMPHKAITAISSEISTL